MSFSNIGNDLYIYFKQENAKKNLFFSVAVFCGICFAQNTVSGKIYSRRCLFRKSRAYWKKTVSSDVSGNYLIKGCHQEMLKYLFPALVFNLLIR
jgi:hypothetical protein